MACLYLLQGSPFYESRELAMLFIKHVLNTLMNAYIMEASLIRLKNGNVVIYTPTMDYSCCPNSLEHFFLYEFTSIYKTIASIEQLLFKKPHLQHASHSLKTQTLRCIVNVSEVRLPNIS
jgi:hypothetical protein